MVSRASAPHRVERPHVVVIGGGVAGLAAAECLARAGWVHVTLLEAGDRFGGCVATLRTGGFVVELGPDVIVAAKPDATELAARLGIADRLVGTSHSARGSYIRSGGRLLPLPPGMTGLVPSRAGSLMTTPLLSWSGKLRAACEWFVPRGRANDAESVESFVVRRLGREAYDRMVEPMLAGVFAGDGARLSLDATFPRLRAMEQLHGGILRAMRAAHRAAPREPPGTADQPSAPRTPFLSFRTGLAELPEALAAHLRTLDGVALHLNARVTALERGPGDTGLARRIRVRLGDGSWHEADAVVVAVPAPVAAGLLAPVDPPLGALLADIECVSTATVSVGFRAGQVARALDGTGYTVPRVEGGPVLACTWSSAKFEERAPRGHVLVRVFLGGAGREWVLERDDAGLVTLALAELGTTIGAHGTPVLTRITRWRDTLPQYALGHLRRVAAVEARLDDLPWLGLAGNALWGIGVPDCIRSGESAAERVLRVLRPLPASGGLAQPAS